MTKGMVKMTNILLQWYSEKQAPAINFTTELLLNGGGTTGAPLKFEEGGLSPPYVMAQ